MPSHRVLESGLEVSARMTAISVLFQECLKYTDSCPDETELHRFLMSQDGIFRPVAFEAAAMSMAIDDFVNRTGLKRWQHFLNENAAFRAPIHVGLGWAMARLKPNLSEVLKIVSAKMAWRIFDGWGYHDGFFRGGQQRPELGDVAFLQSYYQGIGRSIWYESKGEVGLLKPLLSGYDAVHFPHIWTGIGIAALFVGGLNSEKLYLLKSAASTHRWQLHIAVVFAALVRTETSSMTADVEEACRTWLNSTPEEVVGIGRQCEPDDYSASDFLEKWKAAMIREFQKKHR